MLSLPNGVEYCCCGYKVNNLKHKFSREESKLELPSSVKQKMIDEILGRLKRVNDKLNVSAKRGETPRSTDLNTNLILLSLSL